MNSWNSPGIAYSSPPGCTSGAVETDSGLLREFPSPSLPEALSAPGPVLPSAETAITSSDTQVSYSSASSRRTFSAGGGGYGYSSGGREGGFDAIFSFGVKKPFASSSFFGDNDKQTMQNLNHRLANYLDKVYSLEESNTELERKIREWYEKQDFRATFTQRDYSNYYATIEELRAQIFDCTTDKSSVILEVDNARLAAEDFKLKYENELGFHRSVEADINGLRRVLDQLTMSRTDLEIQTESLNDELAYLKKNHDEEMGEMGTNMTGQISVEMDAAPGINLTNILAEMRGKYEMMADENRREAETKFIATSEKLQKGVMANVEQVQSGKSEITELRRSLQGLEIELQAEVSLKASLAASLSESECSYGAQLFQIQSTISGLEAQLTDLRSDMGRQNHEYNVLLDVKNRLQMEINMYQKLLDSQDANSTATKTNKSIT